MKKVTKFYAIAWVLLLIVFNAAAVILATTSATSEPAASFWVGYAFVNLSLIGQLVCAVIGFSGDSAKKMFYNIPLLRVSVAGLIVSFIFGLGFMVVPFIPTWVGAIVCMIIMLLNVFAIFKASVLIDAVNAVDEKVETATAFIYDMRAKSETLLFTAKDEAAKAACKQVRDALKYSDPMSNPALSSVEVEIQVHFELLKKAVAESKEQDIASETTQVLALVAQRNNQCKRLK